VNVFRPIALLSAALALAPVALCAQDMGLNIDVNGAQVAFDQPPLQRAGRIYVPLRGIFERLGATVVYADGQINATSGTHTIGLRVGSTIATIDGHPQYLDSPPLLDAGRTLVPLRFVSQALGASVSYDAASRTVRIAQAVASPSPPPAPIVLRLLRLEPAVDESTNLKRPELSGSFSEPVNPNTIGLTIDGRDVTQDTYVTERSFSFVPNFDLPPGPHQAVVSGRTPAHEPFTQSWSFTVNANADTNYIHGLEPPNGMHARTGFTVSGITKPGSLVRITTTTSETVAGFSETASGSTVTETGADRTGYFETRVELPEPATAVVDVRIISTAPDGVAAVRTLRLRP
jgi:hypothetical protein